MDILTVSHLTKIYGEGEAATRALDDVSFSVEEGEFVAIVGSSGSGKSTLLHLIGGVDRPTSGHVLLNGADVYARSDEELAVFRRREVGLVYQFYNLVPVLNVVENMTLPVALDGRAVNAGRLQGLVQRLGLAGREGHLPSQLSGGQQQRVAIGRALMNAPAVVLADRAHGQPGHPQQLRDHAASARFQPRVRPDHDRHHPRRGDRAGRRSHHRRGGRLHRARREDPPMNATTNFTVKSLRANKVRTLVTIAGVALAAALLTAVLTTYASLNDFLYRNEAALAGTWMACVEADGSSALDEKIADAQADSQVSGTAIMRDIGFAELTADQQDTQGTYLAIRSIEGDVGDICGIDAQRGAPARERARDHALRHLERLRRGEPRR